MPDKYYDSVPIEDSINDLESGGEKSSISTKYNGGEEEKNWNS
jgi:hypothetical protein